MANNDARLALVFTDLTPQRVVTPLGLSGYELNLVKLAVAARAQRFRARASEARRRDDLLDTVRDARVQQNLDLADEYQSIFDRIDKWEEEQR